MMHLTKIFKAAKHFLGTKAASKISERKNIQFNFFKSPFVLAFGGIIIMALVLLMLTPIIAIGSTTSLSIMQSLSPDNDAEGDVTGNSIVGTGKILLIAGHSYSPYCNQVENECRQDSTKYQEPDETRKLVKLIKKELDALNVENDIANVLLGGTDEKMNKSFFVESVQNTDKFNSIDWSQYGYVLEVHFNALDTKTSGPLLVKLDSSQTTDADKGIIKAVTKNTGTSQQGDVVKPINNLSYFKRLNIPMTYLETEFYDNEEAMGVYLSKKEKIAKDIAKVIKDTYGSVSASGDRAKIVERAKSQMGKPYVWGATGPDSYDCSGLVSYALTGKYERIGTTSTFWGWQETKNPQPGDVAVKDDGNNNGHTGIYIGKDENGVPQMIHAPQAGENVKIGPVQSGMKYVIYPGLKS